MMFTSVFAEAVTTPESRTRDKTKNGSDGKKNQKIKNFWNVFFFFRNSPDLPNISILSTFVAANVKDKAVFEPLFQMSLILEKTKNLFFPKRNILFFFQFNSNKLKLNSFKFKVWNLIDWKFDLIVLFF